MSEIDTFNKFMVGTQGKFIVLMNPPRTPMTKKEALTLAAWLVAMSDENDEFTSILEAVCNT